MFCGCSISCIRQMRFRRNRSLLRAPPNRSRSFSRRKEASFPEYLEDKADSSARLELSMMLETKLQFLSNMSS
jgi:hypothetical protein